MACKLLISSLFFSVTCENPGTVDSGQEEIVLFRHSALSNTYTQMILSHGTESTI